MARSIVRRTPAAAASPASRRSRRNDMAGKLKRIDVHNHVCPDTLIEVLRRSPERFGMRAEGSGDNVKLSRLHSKHVFHLVPELHEVQAKLAGLDERGLDGA